MLAFTPQALDPIETPAEKWWAKNQPTAGGAVKFASMLVSASGLPGAGVISAVMDKVLEAAAVAKDNLDCCKRLVWLVTRSDRPVRLRVKGETTRKFKC